MATREQIYEAVFALTQPLEAAGTLKVRSRMLRSVSSLGAESQPALYQIQTGESFDPRTGTPPIRTLKVAWVIYTNRGEESAALASTTINAVLDALEAILQPLPGKDAVTLDGVVAFARLVSPIEIDEGVLSQQALSILHIEILCPEGFTC